MPSSIPLLIYGTISESGSGVDTITVKARNETTNDTLTTTTTSAGLYVFDVANFTSGYADGDQITVYTIYQNFEGQGTITVALPVFLYEESIALSTIEDSEVIDYCTVQDVYDELDDKTSADIAATKIVRKVQEAEALVDLKTDTSFKINTVTDKVYSINRYTIETSPVKLDTVSPFPQRSDRWGYIQNRVKVENTPIIAVTSLSRNTAASVSADVWTVLTQQTGSGGDYMVVNRDTGTIDFLNNYPSIGERSWKITHTWGHDPDSTDRDIIARIRVVRRITALLASKYILSRKSSGSIFNSTQDIKIGTIEIKGSGSSVSSHISDMNEEIDDLWKSLGELGIEVI